MMYRSDSNRRRVTNELINAFKKVTGYENMLSRIVEAALDAPDDAVREVRQRAEAGLIGVVATCCLLGVSTCA